MPGEITGALIRVAADRLAELVDGLSPTDWIVSGRVGDSPVTVGELVAAPLHSSHRLLALNTAARATRGSDALAVRVEREPSLVR
jgi:hypothetical protein